MAALTECSALAEKHSRDLVPLFLSLAPPHDEELKVEPPQQQNAGVNGAQDDLEQIVSFLESKPLLSSTATFATSQIVGKETTQKGIEDVDVAGEIPDEE